MNCEDLRRLDREQYPRGLPMDPNNRKNKQRPREMEKMQPNPERQKNTYYKW